MDSSVLGVPERLLAFGKSKSVSSVDCGHIVRGGESTTVWF
jgi:hypothetical protein